MSTTFDPAGSQPLPATSNNALPPGSVVGDFTIQGLVGEGGFGVVYRAFDNGMQREVALKEYMPNALARRRADGQVELRAPQYESTFAAGRKSFVNEAKLLAQFDHTALVKVLRFFEANGTAYMVMPLYHGRTLKQLLRESPGVDEAWIKSMLAPLLDALETLHGARCFHRDVAPDNILILDSGGPLLLDFGAARRIIGDMTQAVTVVIKPGYAPVEQYADDNSLQQGPWTDIYALAAVVRLAITGKPPATSVTRMVSDPVKPLADVAQGYSAAFLRAIDYGLAVRPEDRPQSIAEFRQVLGLSPAAIGAPAAPAAPSPAPLQPRPAPPAPAAAAPIPAPGPAVPHASAPPPQPSGATPPPFATQRVAAPPPAVAAPTQPSGAAPPPSATQRAAAPLPFGTQKAAAAPPLAAEAASQIGGTVPMRSHQTVSASPAPVTAPIMASAQSRPPASPSPRPQWLPIAIVVAMMVVVVGAGYLVMQAVTSPPARETMARAPVPSPSPVTPPPAPAPKAAPPAPAPAPPPASPPPQAEPPQATTPPPQASPPPTAGPTAPPPSATPAPAPAPETRPQPSTPPATAPAPSPPSAATPTAPVPVPPAAVPATPAPPTGRVMLDIKPWGEVVVDGRARGLSPPLKVLQLPEGAHRIEVRNPAGAALVRDVKVTAAGRVEISHTFR